MRSWAWHTSICLTQANGLTALTPLRLPRHIAVFIYGVFTIVPPSSWRLLEHPRLHVWLLCIQQSQRLRRLMGTLLTTSLTMAIHPLSWLLDISTKGLSPTWVTRQFPIQSQHLHRTNIVLSAGYVSPSASAFSFFSSLTICGAPAVTAWDVRVFFW